MFYNSDRLNHHNKIIPVLKLRKRRQWCNIIELPSTVRGWSSDRRNPACVVSILRCFLFLGDGGVMWSHAAWQAHTRQKMGYDFARIGARQRCGETLGQERHWNRAATYFDGKFFLDIYEHIFCNISRLKYRNWIFVFSIRVCGANDGFHWDCPSTVRGLPSDRRNSACVVGILRCFCFTPNWENEYWRCETVQLDKCIPARKWDTTLRG